MVRSILIVEDEKDIQKYLKEMLLDNGFSVHATSDGIQALEYIKKTRPDLVLLDLTLPKLDGEALCKEIKELYPDVIIIMLTAKDTPSDIVKGLKLGADDYVKKPFNADELLARIHAQFRKIGDSEEIIRVYDLEINNKTLEVSRNKKSIHLTPQELKLLQYLIQNKGRVVTRDMILDRIWLHSSDIETRVVDVYVGYLRKKIDTNFRKKLIHSVRGFGYILRD